MRRHAAWFGVAKPKSYSGTDGRHGTGVEHLRPISKPVGTQVAWVALCIGVTLSGLVMGCGDKITILECPPGTRPEGSKCISLTPKPDVGIQDTTSGDGRIDGLAEFPIADLGQPDPGPTDEGAEAESESTDAVSDAADVSADGDVEVDAPTVSVIGTHCALTSDCDGGTCLGWPSGYCTELDCTAGSCPANTACIELAGGNTACLASCDSIVDCLTDSTQGCKALPQVGDTEPVKVCHGVESGAGDVGDLCDGDLVCANDAVCLATIPGGYCAVVGCEEGGCAAGSACVKFDGAFTCMATCGIDEHCPAAPDAERKCADLKTPSLSLQKVCIAAGSGKNVGELCVGGVECGSGVCEILGDGQCSQTDGPCFDESDCNGAEFCITGPDKIVGVCSASCAVGTPCPGASHCTGVAGAANGVCRPACTGPTDTTSCPADAGFECVYGNPLGDSSGQGKYVCFIPGEPAPVGWPCAAGTECESGLCGASGLCEATCGADYYCPFPGNCVAGPSLSGCLKACFSNVDCPGGTTCGLPQGSLNKVCQ